MASLWFIWILTLCFIFQINFEYCDGARTSNKIYRNIESNKYCFRRMNATHQVGCSSSRGGNVGVIHYAETKEDLDWICEMGPDFTYIAVLPITKFTMKNMLRLKNSGRVNGILVLRSNDSKIESFSPDRTCPNENSGLYFGEDREEYSSCKKGEWNYDPNNAVSGMMFEDWGMPIFLIENQDTHNFLINSCYRRFNEPINGQSRPWPLCSAELKSNMLAAKDSPTCMRRSKLINLTTVKYCDPIHQYNLFATLLPMNKTVDVNNRSVIVVGTRTDTFSMFNEVAPGADSAVTGLVTLFAIAKTLADKREDIEKKIKGASNVLFSVFNGESFDYIGSSRAVYDMIHDQFPMELMDDRSQPALLKLSHVHSFIELNQLMPHENNDIFIHTDPISTKVEKVNKSVNAIVKLLTSYDKSIKTVNYSIPLPPASVQSFLQSDLDIPAVVLTNHDHSFTNPHYNSLFDESDPKDPLLVKQLTKVATVVSQTVYQLLTESNEKLVVNETLIEQLLECYLKNASCPFFRELFDSSYIKALPESALPLYVGVLAHGNIMNTVTKHNQYVLSYLTGNVDEERDKSNCSDKNDAIFLYNWMPGTNYAEESSSGVCMKSTVYYTYAKSPADELNDWSSKMYSTWTESVWIMASVRVFLSPSVVQEVVTLILGIFILVLSFLVVYIANKQSSILFGNRLVGLQGC